MDLLGEGDNIRLVSPQAGVEAPASEPLCMSIDCQVPSPLSPVIRHRLSVRICHWVNAVVFLMLLLSGWVILLAHPRLYWGEVGYYGDPAWLDLPLSESLAYSGYARSVHFLAAWVLVINGAFYLLYGLANGHFLRRLVPTFAQLQPAQVMRDLWAHLGFKVHVGADNSYNLLQKISYLGVLFVLLPLVLLTGLTMSPAITTDCPWLFDMFGGRQSARSLHFIVASLLLLFSLVHVFQVVLLGFRHQVMAMITGRSAMPAVPPASLEIEPGKLANE